MLVGRAGAADLSLVRRCQFIISLNCVFSVCVYERVCESVCVCINKYIVTVVIVNLLSFYSLQRVVEAV